MFGLIWTTLLFSVGGVKADTSASVVIKEDCRNGFCITLSEGEVTAEAGLCVVIPCSFTTTSSFTPHHIVWFKCEPSRPKCRDSDIIFHTNKNKVQSGFKGRVSLLEPDVSRRNCSIIINDLTESDSGSYQLRVNDIVQNGKPFPIRANLSVKALIQKPTVMIPPLTEGQQSTLTCTAPGLCSGSDPKITWTWRGAGEKDSHLTGNITAVQRRSSTLTFNSSAEHHGTEVTCKVSFTGDTTTEETRTLNVTYVKELEISGITTNQTTHAEVNVTFFQSILSSSACAAQLEVLTCVCISEGFPLPTIKWPLLDNHTEYSVTTSVSNHTVNNSITISVKDRSYTTVECVSSSDAGDAIKKLKIITNELKQEDILKILLRTFDLKVVIAFLIGMLLSATICCLARTCSRNKQKKMYNMAETLEMVTTEEAPLIVAGQALENDGTHDQEAAEGGAEAAGQSAPDSDVEPKEVEYSNIDFSLLKRSTGAEDTPETTETEYAEIKNKEIKERQDSGGEEGVKGGGEEEEEEGEEGEVIIWEDEETKQCISTEEEGGEDVPVYSNVNEIMGET